MAKNITVLTIDGTHLTLARYDAANNFELRFGVQPFERVILSPSDLRQLLSGAEMLLSMQAAENARRG